MQLMADSVAAARQEMAQARTQSEAARARAAEDVRSAAEWRRRQNTDRNGLTMDFGYRFQPDGFEINPAAAEAMQKPEVRQAIDAAVRTAMADARKAINAAIAKATGQSEGLLPDRETFSYDIPAPPGAFPVAPIPPVPPAARAIPAPSAPPRAPLPPVPALPN
jgi:hypothetical protein